MRVFNIAIIIITLTLPVGNLYARDISNVIGVNTNFFYSPLGPQHDEVWQKAKDLGVNLVRFPGGWGNRYDWEMGTIKPRDKRIPRIVKLDDFMSRAKKEGLNVIYVINIFDPIEKIIRLVQSINENNYTVIALELGNELYLKRNIPRIGGAHAYWEKSMKVAKALRNIGNKLPLGIVISPQCVPGNENNSDYKRMNTILSNLDLSNFQAVILHYYLSLKALNGINEAYRVALEGINNCVDRVEKDFPNKKIWLTEWNLGLPANSKYHNTMIHALLVARLYAAIMTQPRITIANIHNLTSIVWELYGPDLSGFDYVSDMSKNDETFSKNPVPLIRTVPYFALQALFQILHDMGNNIRETDYTKFTQYGDLPVDVFTIKGGALEYIVIINPNEKTIPIGELREDLKNTTVNATVLRADRDATNGSFMGFLLRNEVMKELVLPKNDVIKNIEQVSVSVIKK